MKAIYIFLLTFPWAAQQNHIKSLKAELTNNTVEDTIWVKLLNDLAYYRHQISPNEGVRTAAKAISLAEKLNSTRLLITAHKYKGTNHIVIRLLYHELEKFELSVEYQLRVLSPLLFQPFLENNMIICSVDDNGIGMTKIINENTKQNVRHLLGMQLTKSRIDIIHQLKKSKGNLKVIDENKGLCVEVSLPL